MVRKRFLFGSILIQLTLFSCRSEFSDKAQLESYINDTDNGLTQRVDKSPMVMELQFRPGDLLIAQEIKGYSNVNDVKANEARYDSMLYFTFRISQDGKKIETKLTRDHTRLNEVISYLSEGLADDVVAVTDMGTVKPLGVLYAGNFGMTETTDVMIVFSKHILDATGERLQIRFDDHMFGTGLNVFSFKTKDISRVPRLNFKSL